MMKFTLKPRFLPYLALGAGLAGLGLRLWLQTSGTDFLGLFISGHPATILLFALTALTLGLLAWGVRSLPEPVFAQEVFGKSPFPLAGGAAGAAGILLTNLKELQSRDVIAIMGAVLGILAAIAMIYTGFCRLTGRKAGFLWFCAPICYFIAHLLGQYRVWSSEPQLLEYFFPLLASIALMLSAFYRAELELLEKPRRWFVFTDLMALFLCCVATVGQTGFFYPAMGLWAICQLCSLKPATQKMALPEQVYNCIRMLWNDGFKAYAVGGCVRDALLGLTPHDYDLCTNATPKQIARVFSGSRLVRSGEKHGTIGVVLEDQVCEITTFRTEGGYTDGRHPDRVSFVSTIEEDLARRDFTVNAMAYAPGEGFIDPWGGRADLRNKVLRAVGEPKVRFQEDALRILRGVRFAVRFGLTPDEKTEQAMFETAPLMDKLARERVFDELCKLLPLVTAEDLLRYAPVITQAIPELKESLSFDQHSPHHAFDVFTHIAHVTESVPEDLTLRWAALLHDVGKPATYHADETGRGHFHGHAKVSAEMADRILQRLKAPTQLRRQVVFLIEQHMTPLEPDKKLLRRRLTQYGPEDCQRLLQLQRADFCSKGTAGNTEYFDRIAALLEEILQEQDCVSIQNLAINGRDLLTLGFEAGPRIGQVLAVILEKVQDETLPNERKALLDAARAMKEEQT